MANVGDLIATLSCDLEGTPLPKIAWFKDDKEIAVPSMKYDSFFNEGIAELTVKNIEETDAGTYSCRATNDLGSITTKAKLTINAPAKKAKAETVPATLEKKKKTAKPVKDDKESNDNPPNFHHKLSDCKAKLGETHILVVTNTTLPEPTVEWYHNGEHISQSDANYQRRHDKGRYELHILDVKGTDAGKWKAVGKNAYGECESECEMKVIIPDGQFAPSFDHPLKDIKCKEQEMLKLEVKIAANPPPEINWYRDNKEIQHSERHRLIFDDGAGHYGLTIIDAYAEDSGEYKCVAKNKIGKAHTVCCVRIEELASKRSKKIDDSRAPKFRMQLPNPREVPEGSEMPLVCTVSGTPYPKITWYKDERKIDSDKKHDMRCENGVCTLTVFNTSMEDAGNYICEAENMHGVARSVSQVKILPSLDKDQSKPKFVEHLVNTTATEGNEIVLECCVNGKPTPSITWYKDGLKLLIENRMLQYTDRKGVARLNIMNVVTDDAGEYTCEAVNNLGKDFTHATVKVVDMGLSKSRLTPVRSRSRSRSKSPLRAQEGRAPVVTRPLQDTTVTEGNRELLEVEVDSFPEPMIEWYHDGKLVAESRTLRTYFDGRVAFLKIYEAQLDHQGQYLCKISNKLGSVETRANLIVTNAEGDAEHVPNMPTFVKKLQDATAKKAGESVTLNCQVHGQPKPEIVWLFNGKAIHNKSNIRSRVFDDNAAVLEITSLKAEDCGTYTAVAKNQFGDVHSSCDVKIEGAEAKQPPEAEPYFVVEPKPKITVEEGGTLTITTDINGSPEPEIQWMRNNQPLSDNGRLTLKKTGLSCSLNLTNVTLEDEGTYTVTARNSKGQIRQNTEVVVTAKKGDKKEKKEKVPKKDDDKADKKGPSAPKGVPKVSKIGKDSADLSFQEVKDADSYKVEGKQPDEQSWSECATTKSTSVTVKNLKPNTEYQFRVAAVRGSEQSNWSKPSLVAKTEREGQLPKFTKVFDEIKTVTEGDQILLEAEFSGTPQPVAKWYHNSVELKSSDNTTIKTDKAKTTLKIASCNKDSHDGVFSCHLENANGIATMDCKVSVDIKESSIKSTPESSQERKKAPPTVIKGLNNETANVGQQFILSCKVSAKPEGTVQWFKENEKLASTGRYEMSSDGKGNYKLTCHSTQTTDSGNYRFVITNEDGKAETDCEVIIEDLSEQVPPTFEKSLSDITVLARKDTHLECKIAGHPKPDVVWTKDGEMLITSRKVKVQFLDDGVCRLVINNCAATDTGIYACSATNCVGVESCHAMVTVAETSGTDSHLVIAEVVEEKQAKPRFVRAPPSTVEVPEGGQFKLIAKAIGEPKPNITWKKDGREIQRTNKMYSVYLTSDGESHLVAECVVSKTSGIFTCSAQNIHGDVVTETQIIVQKQKVLIMQTQAPEFTEVLKDLGVVNGHPVTLTCKIRGVPEPELKWVYIDDSGNSTNLTSDGGWIECRGGEVQYYLKENCNYLFQVAELKAERVFRSQQGTYQCIATNDHGQAISQCYLLIGG